MYAGHEDAVAGRFDDVELIPVEYTIPTNPNAWPFVFYVSGEKVGEAMRWGSSPWGSSPWGGTYVLPQVDIPAEREQEFKRLILRIKPLYTWAALIVNYV
jgi:hypothetical protein